MARTDKAGQLPRQAAFHRARTGSRRSRLHRAGRPAAGRGSAGIWSRATKGHVAGRGAAGDRYSAQRARNAAWSARITAVEPDAQGGANRCAACARRRRYGRRPLGAPTCASQAPSEWRLRERNVPPRSGTLRHPDTPDPAPTQVVDLTNASRARGTGIAVSAKR